MIRFRHKTFLSDSKEEEGTCALFVEPSSGLASGVLVIPILRSKDRSEGAIPQIPALSTFKDDVIGFSVKRPALWRLRWESQAAATAVVQENLKILRASELITGRILPRNNPYDSSTIMGSSAYRNRVESELSAKCQKEF